MNNNFTLKTISPGQAFIISSYFNKIDGNKGITDSYEQIGNVLSEKNMEIVQERIFASLSVKDEVLEKRKKILTKKGISPSGPFNYIEGHPLWGEGYAGTIIRAFAPGSPDDFIENVSDENSICGKMWKRKGNKFLTLQNIYSPKTYSERKNQAYEMFEKANSLLNKESFNYSDVVRTWLYISEILSWYGDFNEARNKIYDELGIMQEEIRPLITLPASTGIDANNQAGKYCTMDLLAVKGPEVTQLTNKKQQDAFLYRSAFSRGAIIKEEDLTLIQLSGTASIDEKGITVHKNDPKGQIIRTLENIEALLEQRGAGLKDICAASIFVKDPSYWDLFKKVYPDNLPGICIVTDICRDDLLFEIDGEVSI